MTQLGKFTRRIESTLGKLLGTQPGDASEPLDLITGILHDIEQQVEPGGGGRRFFPFTHIAIIVLAPQKTDQDRYAAALEHLDAKIRERLKELACDPPARLVVDLQFARKPRKNWSADQRVDLSFSRDTAASAASVKGAPAKDATPKLKEPPSSQRESAPAVRLVVLRGTAGKTTYSLEQSVIRFGRGEDLADAVGRTRRNDIVFQEGDDEVNRTVARAQAHVRFDPARREFRLFDDGSSNGTRIVRDADLITVTPHGPRGVRVESGDILEFGRARVRFEIKA